MTFTQWNHLMAHFSEIIPGVKRHMKLEINKKIIAAKRKLVGENKHSWGRGTMNSPPTALHSWILFVGWIVACKCKYSEGVFQNIHKTHIQISFRLTLCKMVVCIANLLRLGIGGIGDYFCTVIQNKKKL